MTKTQRLHEDTEAQASQALTVLAPGQLTGQQLAFLASLAEHRYLPVAEVCQKVTLARSPHPTAVTKWLKKPIFRHLYESIRNDPAKAAQFLLAHSQADAVAALVRNVRGEGARTSTDAAQVILREVRERALGQKALEALDRLLEEG